MKKQISNNLISFAFGTLILLFAIGFYIFAWIEPSTAPPGGNVPAPINVGNVAQTKSGKLGIGFYDPNYYLSVGTSTAGVNAGLKITNPGSQPSFYVEDEPGDTTPFVIDAEGNVGIGTTGPFSKDFDTLAIMTATLPTGRSYLSCAENSASHKIYCFGGDIVGGLLSSNQILEYDPVRDTIVIKTATLPTGRSGLSCTENSASHKIYCFGGGTNQIVEYTSSLFFKLKVNGIVRALGGFSTGDELFFGNLNEDTDYIRGSVNLNLIGTERHKLTIKGWGNVIFDSGNVGIGTMTPEAKLDVVGTVRTQNFISSDFTFEKDGKKIWRMYEKEDGIYLENLITGKQFRILIEEAK